MIGRQVLTALVFGAWASLGGGPASEEALLSIGGVTPMGVVSGIHILDSSQILTVGWDRTIRFWKAQGAQLAQVGTPARLPGGKAFNGRVFMSALRHDEGGKGDAYLAVAWNGSSFEADRAASASQNNISLYSLRKTDGEYVVHSKCHYWRAGKQDIKDIAVSSKGQVAVVLYTNQVVLLSPVDDAVLQEKPVPKLDTPSAVSFDAAGDRLAIATRGKEITVLDSSTLKLESIKSVGSKLIKLNWKKSLLGISESQILFDEKGEHGSPSDQAYAYAVAGTATGQFMLAADRGKKFADVTAMDCESEAGPIALANLTSIKFGDSELVVSPKLMKGAIGWDERGESLMFDANFEKHGEISVAFRLKNLQLEYGRSFRDEIDTKNCKLFTVTDSDSGSGPIKWEGAKPVTYGNFVLNDWPRAAAMAHVSLYAEKRLAVRNLTDPVIRIYDLEESSGRKEIDPTYYIYAMPRSMRDAGSVPGPYDPAWFIWHVPTNQVKGANGGEMMVGYMTKSRGNYGLAEWIPYGQAFSDERLVAVGPGDTQVDTFPVDIVRIDGGTSKFDGDKREISVPSGEALQVVLRSKNFEGDGEVKVSVSVGPFNRKDARGSRNAVRLREDEVSAKVEEKLPPGVYTISCQVTAGGRQGVTGPITLKVGNPQLSNSLFKTVVVSVGNNKFEHINPLNYAEKDANDLSALYKSQGDPYEVLPPSLGSLSKTSLNKEIDKAKASIAAHAEGANLILFISSHGIVDKSGKGYLVLSNSDPKDFNSLYSWDDILSKLAETRARNILVLIDACYSGSALGDLVKSGTDIGNAQQATRLLASRGNISIITSSTAAQTSFENQGNAVFTGVLLKMLRGEKTEGINIMSYQEQGFLAVDSLLWALKLEVNRVMKEKLAGYGVKTSSETGQFYCQEPDGYISNRYFYVARVPK